LSSLLKSILVGFLIGFNISHPGLEIIALLLDLVLYHLVILLAEDVLDILFELDQFSLFALRLLNIRFIILILLPNHLVISSYIDWRILITIY